MSKITNYSRKLPQPQIKAEFLLRSQVIDARLMPGKWSARSVDQNQFQFDREWRRKKNLENLQSSALSLPPSSSKPRKNFHPIFRLLNRNSRRKWETPQVDCAIKSCYQPVTGNIIRWENRNHPYAVLKIVATLGDSGHNNHWLSQFDVTTQSNLWRWISFEDSSSRACRGRVSRWKIWIQQTSRQMLVFSPFSFFSLLSFGWLTCRGQPRHVSTHPSKH